MIPKFLLRLLTHRRWLFISFFLLDGLLLLAAFAFPEASANLLYVLILGILIQILCLILDAWKEYRHYQRLLIQLSQPEVAMEDSNTPLSEVALWESIFQLRHQVIELQQAQQANYHEQLDYYTLWAHQIKTPIAATQLLLEQLSASDPSRPLLQQELFKISQYVELVLHYLRMENFHQDLQLEPLNLQELVHQVVKKYASFFIHKPIRLELDQLDYSFVSDRKWLELLIEQLLSNAIKYTPQGSIRIYQEAGILHIEDTGIGIQTQDIPRIFERGFTGFNGRLSQQSSGLGLYLSKTLAKNLGFNLSLHSQLGQGTQVTLDLNQATLAQD